MSDIKILVYDHAHGFSRLIKFYFSKDYNIHTWRGGGKDVEKIDLSMKYISFIQVHSYDDLKEGMIIAHISKLVFWSSSINDIKKSFENVDNFIYLDMQLTKTSLIPQIKAYLEINSF